MSEVLGQLVPTVLILGALIFVHELGHFVACRFSGVAVEKFSIGFGPELITWQWKGTRYSLSLIPFGGFVKPKGETQEDIGAERQPEPGDFLFASKGQRFAILIAGVVMNFAFAYVLFVLVMLMGRPILAPTIGGFVEGYPAQTSGLMAGDQVTHLNGNPVSNWKDLAFAILESKSSVLEFMVVREGRSRVIEVMPEFEEGRDIFGQQRQVPRIGIKPADHVMTERFGIQEALVKAAQYEWRLSALTFEALWRLVTGQLSLRAISGPIGIIAMAGTAAKAGAVALIQFTAILSVSLAVINLLPIPALDGGHLLFLGLEVIRGRQISISLQERVTRIGFYFLLALMAVVVYNDLVTVNAFEKLKSIGTRAADLVYSQIEGRLSRSIKPAR